MKTQHILIAAVVAALLAVLAVQQQYIRAQSVDLDLLHAAHQNNMRTMRNAR